MQEFPDAGRTAGDSLTAAPFSAEWYALMQTALGDVACRQLGFYVIPSDILLSVVIPVYNEVKTLETLIDNVRRVLIRTDLILIDDCSSDGSPDLLRSLVEQDNDDSLNRIMAAFHDRNRGKVAPLRMGVLA